MWSVLNLRVGRYTGGPVDCVGRDYVDFGRSGLLISTIYDPSMNRYETMVFNSKPPEGNDGDVDFDAEQMIMVLYYSLREDSVSGHRSIVSSQASSLG